MRMHPEAQLLDLAVLAFEAETALTISIVERKVRNGNGIIDGLVDLPRGAGRLAVEVKKWAQQANVGALANQIKSLPMEGMLVADYVNPNMAEKLRELDIEFIDTAGNAYINHPPLYIWVKSNKPDVQLKEPKVGGGRAFDATGLKVVFGFLCDPDLVKAPYRKIAERTEVALGTVGQVVQALKAAGFLIERKQKKERKLINQKRLFERWVEAYPEKLKPKLKVGDFAAGDPTWWKAFNIEKYGAFWGGEVAAAKYTGYLKPKVATVYLPEARGTKLLAAARLKKANYPEMEEHLVTIYRPFWQLGLDKNREKEAALPGIALPGIVPPILIYADLVATGDSRNLETAREIYERYIAEYIGGT